MRHVPLARDAVGSSRFDIACRLHQAGNPDTLPEPPSGEGWIHEIKHDGYRTLIIIDRGSVSAYSRQGLDRAISTAGGKLPSGAAFRRHGVTEEAEWRNGKTMTRANLTSPDRLRSGSFSRAWGG